MRKLSKIVALLSVVFLPLNFANGAVISLDFNIQNTDSPFQISPTMTGEEVAGVGNIFTGQVGAWNTLLVGSGSFASSNGIPASTTSPLTTSAMLAGDGSATPVTFTFGVGATVGSPVLFDVFGNPGTGSTDLRQDMLLQGTSRPGPTSWEIAGLIPGNSYDVALFGQRYNNAAFNPAGWTIFGNAPDLLDSQNDGNYLGVIANAQGKLTGTFEYASSSFAAWSGLQIEGTFVVPPVPEPSSFLLLLMGIAGLNRCRRKSSRTCVGA